MGELPGISLTEVTEYRAYIVGADGHFLNCRASRCADDNEAIVWEKQLVDGHDVELWSASSFGYRQMT